MYIGCVACLCDDNDDNNNDHNVTVMCFSMCVLDCAEFVWLRFNDCVYRAAYESESERKQDGMRRIKTIDRERERDI